MHFDAQAELEDIRSKGVGCPKQAAASIQKSLEAARIGPDNTALQSPNNIVCLKDWRTMRARQKAELL